MLTRSKRPTEVERPPRAIAVYRDAYQVYFNRGKWIFYRWEYAPGPGPDDVYFETDTLDAVVHVAIEYYCGTGLLIDGWQFPVHKHPEWDATRIEASYRRARTVTSGEWFEIQREYHRRYLEATRGNLPGWPNHPELTFRRIDHLTRTDQVLWLRRDGGEVYIVHSLESRISW